MLCKVARSRLAAIELQENDVTFPGQLLLGERDSNLRGANCCPIMIKLKHVVSY
jgi:hypothetical protein